MRSPNAPVAAVLIGGALVLACVEPREAAAPRRDDRPKALVATSIQAEWESTCAVDEGGALHCWGRNGHGAPIDGLLNLVVSWPKRVPRLSNLASYALPDVFGLTDCALRRDGSVICGSPHEALHPVALPRAKSIVHASAFACAVVEDGKVMCWGTTATPAGRTLSGDRTPMEIDGPTEVASLSARSGRACAVGAGGALHCWDGNLARDGKAKRIDVPPLRSIALAESHTYIELGLDRPRLGLETEGGHACAILADGGVRCWGGANLFGELGVGKRCHPTRCSTTFADQPNVAFPPGVEIASLALGLVHSCALATDGRAFCWGTNADGHLGAHTPVRYSTTPVLVESKSTFKQLSAANNHTCGLTTGGEVQCWGKNDDGQLGRASRTPPSFDPKPVAF